MADDRKVKLPAGLAGPGIAASALGEVERVFAADEPPPLPPNAMLEVIGKPTTRVDARAKVTGAARFTSDVRLPGMLWARAVRSPYAHARIRSIDTSAAERLPGVKAVHVVTKSQGVLGTAVLRDPAQEEPSRFPIVRYVGQPVAAVAATTTEIATEALRLVKIDYEVLPFVVDVEEARQAGAPLVFPGAADAAGSAGGGGGAAGVPQTGNVHGPARSGPLGPPRGDVAVGFGAADVIVEGTYRTQVQTHAALETHGVVAVWEGEGLTVYASTQGTATVRDEMAAVFNLRKTDVRVVTEFMGGGFGAKFGAGNFGVLAAHLAKKAGAPVRLMLDRAEEHQAAGNRPGSVQHLRIGAKKDGTLTAIHLEAYGTGGVATGAGCGGPAKNMYACPNVLIEESDVFTHAGPAAAFRAPGHPQGCFALEQTIDELADKLGIDPLALRDRIDVDEDLGGRNVDSAARKEERRLGAARIGWASRKPHGSEAGVVKRGIGVAQSIWYRFVDLDSACEVRVHRDGSVELLSAVQDLGTGIRTALAQVVAEELGLRPGDIQVRIGDTRFPQGPASGGSKTTGSITPAARHAAWSVKRQLLEQVAPALEAKPEELITAGGKILVKADPRRALSWKGATAKLKTDEIAARESRREDYGGFIEGKGRNRGGIGGYGGVQFAAVAVDTETGRIKVERVVAVHDCGRPINPLGIENQINGGVIQGISYALYENRVLDRHSGRMVNANLEQYKILGARDVPAIDVILLEQYHGRSATDAGGIGEPATIPTAAAVANAVHNALGVRLRELPMTPARVLAALSKRGAR
jgi:xanthine dehydrogenase YagR molybdenum-binding subunit